MVLDVLLAFSRAGKHYVSLFARRMKKQRVAAAAHVRGHDGSNPIRGRATTTETVTRNDEVAAEAEEGRGEWLCFDDAHIRVLASWKEAKRFCAKVMKGGGLRGFACGAFSIFFFEVRRSQDTVVV